MTALDGRRVCRDKFARLVSLLFSACDSVGVVGPFFHVVIGMIVRPCLARCAAHSESVVALVP